jgi:hypothetical protein
MLVQPLLALASQAILLLAAAQPVGGKGHLNEILV